MQVSNLPTNQKKINQKLNFCGISLIGLANPVIFRHAINRVRFANKSFKKHVKQ